MRGSSAAGSRPSAAAAGSRRAASSRRTARSCRARRRSRARRPRRGSRRAASRQRSTGPSSPNCFDALDRAVERHPGHHLRMGEVLRGSPRTSQMPSSGSRQIALEVREQRALQRPAGFASRRGRRAAPDAARPSPRRRRRAATGRARRCRCAPAASPRSPAATAPPTRSAAARRRCRT